MGRRFTALVKKGSKDYVALCLELDVVSSGHTVKDALKNLSDAVAEFLSYAQEEGLEKEQLPRPVSLEVLRDFLGIGRVSPGKRPVDLKGYALEVASIG